MVALKIHFRFFSQLKTLLWALFGSFPIVCSCSLHIILYRKCLSPPILLVWNIMWFWKFSLLSLRFNIDLYIYCTPRQCVVQRNFILFFPHFYWYRLYVMVYIECVSVYECLKINIFNIRKKYCWWVLWIRRQSFSI